MKFLQELKTNLKFSNSSDCEHSDNVILKTAERSSWNHQVPWLTEGDRKLRLHVVGLGDVGRTMLVGLMIAGESTFSSIGIFDLNRASCERMERELNQITFPCLARNEAYVKILEEEELFNCDVFLFCATKAVPEVGSGISDVRMAQYEANRGIVALYAKKAAASGYQGLFGVVSDPVDLLCQEVYRAANEDSEKGQLLSEQIQGFGLGVMFARAAYYAAKDPRFRTFSKEGRVFGPHGDRLIAANSIFPEHYDEELSEELTKSVIFANQEVRALGWKPYMAPAISSAALTVLAAVRGEWNDSARYLGGLWFGARNRVILREGQLVTEWENTPLPDALYEKIEESYRYLEGFIL